jgi:hypothetical protein
MAKPARPWIVTPHSPLQKLDDNLWTVTSPVPGVKANRRMSIVRLADGGLVFYHAIPLAEDSLAEVLAWGTPRALVIGHQAHGIDAAPFAERLKMGIYGPAPIEAKMRQRWPQLAGVVANVPKDDRCTFVELEGTKSGEPVQIVKSAGGVSLVWCDAFCATPDEGSTFMTKLLGFAGGPRIIPLFRTFFMNDKVKLKAHFERLASIPNLKRLVPCHGEIISEDAPAVLRRAAEILN